MKFILKKYRCGKKDCFQSSLDESGQLSWIVKNYMEIFNYFPVGK